MSSYRIQKTRKGDFIVRWGSREVARFDTEREAQAWMEEREAYDLRQQQEREAIHAAQREWDKATPDLFDAQLQWQQFMHEFYNALQSEANRVRLQSRMADGLSDVSYASAEYHRQNAAQDAIALREAQLFYYGDATALDTRIKAARREQNLESLTEALNEAEAMMVHMADMLPNLAPPTKKSPRAGTKPNTSIVLNQEELDFIERKYGGSKSAAIHEALRRLMGNGAGDHN